MSLEPNDNFIVQRGSSLYKVNSSDVMAKVQDDDLLLVSRDGTNYKIKGKDFKGGMQNTDRPSLTSVKLTDEGNSATDRFTSESFKATLTVNEDNSSTKEFAYTVSGQFEGVDSITALTSTDLGSVQPIRAVKQINRSKAGWSSGNKNIQAYEVPSTGEFLVWNTDSTNTTIWIVPENYDENNIVKIDSVIPPNGNATKFDRMVWDKKRSVIVARMKSGNFLWESSDNGRTWTQYDPNLDFTPYILAYGVGSLWVFPGSGSNDYGKWARMDDASGTNKVTGVVRDKANGNMATNANGISGNDLTVIYSTNSGVWHWDGSDFVKNIEITDALLPYARVDPQYMTTFNEYDNRWYVLAKISSSASFASNQYPMVWTADANGNEFKISKYQHALNYKTAYNNLVATEFGVVATNLRVSHKLPI